MEIRTVSLLLLCVCQSVFGTLHKDFRLMSKMLPGIYSNKRENSHNRSLNSATKRNDFAMKTLIRPVKVLFLQHAMNVYVEQLYPDHKDVPFKQWIYSITSDKSKRAIRMRLFTILKQEDKIKVHENQTLLMKMSQNSFNTQAECDMYWRRLGNSTFIGATGKRCIGYLRREKIQISVSATLTPTLLQMHEGWYSVKDGSKVVEMENPYTLTKVQKFDIKEYFPFRSRRRHRRRSKRRHRLHSHNQKTSGPYKSQADEELSEYLLDAKLQHKLLTNIISLAGYRNAWSLRDFDSIFNALQSGHKVYYVADMTLCTVHGSIFSHAFGDYVDVFEYSKGSGDDYDRHVTFSHIKISEQKEEPVPWLREVWLYGNNSVIIKLVPLDHYGRRTGSVTTAYCKLFDNNTKLGSVKFSTDPLRNTNQLKTFGSLRSSLNKGRAVRIMVDMSKCSRGTANDHIVGGEIRGFDFLEWRGAIEVALERIYIDDNFTVKKKCLVGKFTRKELIILRTILYDSRSNNQKISKRYKCDIGHSRSLKAVYLYYH